MEGHKSMSKKQITIILENSVDIKYSLLDKVIDRLQKLKEKYEKEYNDLYLDEEYIDEVESIVLKGNRLETNKEYQNRLKQEGQKKSWRQRQYEELKKEFEGSDSFIVHKVED